MEKPTMTLNEVTGALAMLLDARSRVPPNTALPEGYNEALDSLTQIVKERATGAKTST